MNFNLNSIVSHGTFLFIFESILFFCIFISLLANNSNSNINRKKERKTYKNIWRKKVEKRDIEIDGGCYLKQFIGIHMKTTTTATNEKQKNLLLFQIGNQSKNLRCVLF